MPKAGTHLLQRAVALFPGVTNSGVAMIPSAFEQTDKVPNEDQGVALGMGRVIYIREDLVRQEIARVQPAQFASGHVPYSEKLDRILAEAGWKTVTIIRDPRDVAISLAKYQGEKPTHYFSTLEMPERIKLSITGFNVKEPFPGNLMNIEKRYRRVLDWKKSPLDLTTTFESLVGAKGGGSDEVQIRELQRIAAHLGLPEDESTLRGVADAVYGGTTTFRGGTIARWREMFTEEHRQACKEIAGELLVELGYEQDLNW